MIVGRTQSLLNTQFPFLEFEMPTRYLFLAFCLVFLSLEITEAQQKPNVVFILADDWGLGDVKCYGKELCKISTPSMDRLAAEGMRFTEAHSSSSVCTPTRYGVLTGRYNWRSRLKKGVLGGYSAPLVSQKQMTVAKMLKEQGYQTACIGKWHLGMKMPTTDSKPPKGKFGKNRVGTKLLPKDCNVDWDGKITGGPNSAGFDYFFGISASLDMPPYIWIENDKFVGKCTTVKRFVRTGPAHVDFEDYDVLPTIAEKSTEFIAKRRKDGKPFFLYVPLNAPHTPISPSKAFQGKSGLGSYADFVMETDWAIGKISKAISEAGLDQNTLFIVTADNGCSPAAKRGDKDKKLNIKFREGKKFLSNDGNHFPSSAFRGHKADIYEGGHRVPFIAKWQGKVQAGSVCHSPVCLVDLFDTCREMTSATVTDSGGVDSFSLLPLLQGQSKSKRTNVIHHSINGSFALRKGQWKLVFCPGSGGWSGPKPKSFTKMKNLQSKNFQWVQLFDLSSDPEELINLASSNPERVNEMTKEVEKIIARGRSNNGPVQSNDGETFLYPKWIRSAKSQN